MEKAGYSRGNDLYGSFASSADSTVTDTDSSCESIYTDTMEDGQRPLFIMGDEDGKLSSTCTQGITRNFDGRKIMVGVCAMSKKTNSKPMKEILGRLKKFEHLQVIVFDEKMILTDPVDQWPLVDALISFFSNGFPLQKAIEYKNLRKPFVVNDLEAQYILFDRREVYNILVREGIAHPRYAVMNRDAEEKDYFDENEDAIEVNGVTFQRPFVEKPVCAEDHNIYIYFPVSAGGGCQRLFRKVGSRSSVYSTISRVRKSGSYVYEDFMPTDGTDVKVYTVGPDYAHAEARKSPALDGKVERDKDGKEIRYPVLLSASEKMTARKVCMAFKQNVCGFDLLRANGKSYVCDVNGFSFVKNSTKYYDDCANVLGTMIVRALAPQLHIPLILGAAPEDIPVVHTTSGSMMELRCVVAVIRHGDRTPKQKMKMEVKHRKFFQLFEKYGGYKAGHLKLKKPKQLQEILDIARDLLNESGHDHNPEVQEKKAKLRQLKLVLEMYGHFSGINRKVQLKYQPRGAPKRSSSEEDERPREPSLVLIVKWGGELTPAGKFQAEDLGKAFRTLYPGGQGEFETPGLGFLRLHSTFRHDLKIYASDEGRVQMTAAAFTKGLLALEGELTPILVSMVKSANTNGLLDKEGETSKYQHVVKERLMEILNEDREFIEEDDDRLCPTASKSLLNAMKFIENPRHMCDRVFEMVKEITARIKMLKMELKSRELKLYHGESWELLIRRWAKLEKDFKLKSGNYDISKIPDIYDCIKYDLQHNQKTLQYDRAEELFMCSKALADIVIPQEYGIKVEEKLHISQSICTPLMRKIHSDLLQVCQQNAEEESTRLNSKYSKGVSSPERFVRTRLYFTSESHIHSLLNMFRYGGLFDETKDEQWRKATDFLSTTAELNYMTQINIMMFEDPSKEFSSPERFHIELHFSPGAYTSCDTKVMNPMSRGYRTVFLAREKKKNNDEHQVDSENGKKVGKKEGVIQEETISEEGYSDEQEPSVEEPANSHLRSKFHVQKAVPNPSIQIDTLLDDEKVQLQKETGVNVNQSDFEALRGRDNTIENTDSNTDSTETDDGRTAEVDVSEVTLCAENMDNHNIVAKGSLGKQKGSEGQGHVVSSTKDSNTVGVHDTVAKGSTGTQKVEVPTYPCPSEPEGQGHVGASTKDSNTCTVGVHVKHDGNVFTVGKKKNDIESEDVKVVQAFNVGKNTDETGSEDKKVVQAESVMVLTVDEAGVKVSEDVKVVQAFNVGKNTDAIGSEDKKVVQTESVMVQTVDEAGVKVVKTEISEEKSEKCDTVAGAKTCNVEDEGKKRKKSSVSFDLEGKEGLNKGIGLHDQSTKECGTVSKTGDKQKKTFQVEKAKLNDDDGVVFIVGSDSSLVNVKSDQTVESEIKSFLSGSAETKADSHGLEVQGAYNIPQPKSPDPDIPEWDWGDSSLDKQVANANESEDASTSSKKPMIKETLSLSTSVDGKMADTTDMGSPRSVSKPLTIEVKSSKERKRTNSFESLKTYEEARSRSLEDKMEEGAALMEKHYLTIHLPINKDRHFHSFSSLLYLNPDAFKDMHLVPTQLLLASYSAPDLSDCVDIENKDDTLSDADVESRARKRKAFDGFNMVPSLKPLETLHNNLTLKDMDGFLSRSTTTKFFTPVSSPMYGATPLVSPRLPEVTRHKSGSSQSSVAQSLPSSSNSSAGPSSPTSVSTPVDFFSKLKMFILDSQKTEHDQYTDQETQLPNEGDLPCVGSSSKNSSQSISPCSNPSTRHQSSPNINVSSKQGGLSMMETTTMNQVHPRKSPKDLGGDQSLKEEEQKTLTSKSPEAFQYLKPQTENNHADDSAVTPTSDLQTPENTKSQGQKSPTSLIQRLPLKLTEALKLDVGNETRKSAFKKVGQRFHTSHVSEDSLKSTSASGASQGNSISQDSDLPKGNKGSVKEAVIDNYVKEGSLEKEVDFNLVNRDLEDREKSDS